LNDFSALKAHPFFSEVDFSTLSTTPPPFFPSILSPFKPKDSVDFDNLNPYKTDFSSNNNFMDSPENAENGRLKKSSISAVNTQLQAESPLLSKKIDDGKVTYTGLVLKKCGWLFYKPRQVVVKDSGWLYYYDPETNMLKVKNRDFIY
jgi:hypothetical protein